MGEVECCEIEFCVRLNAGGSNAGGSNVAGSDLALRS